MGYRFIMSFHSFRIMSLVLTAVMVLAAIHAPPAHAKKSFFEAMFGWMDDEPEGPDPAQTLVAPFADAPRKQPANAPQLQQDVANPVPLKHANTTEGEIGKWLVTAVSDAMSYNAGQDGDVLKLNEKYFAQSGARQFQEFLVNNNIQKVLESGKYNIRSFVKEDPLLLNSGTANDRFRWLFEVPIMVSYMDSQSFNYKKNDPVNQHIVLTIQVGRFAKVDDPNNHFDVLIETWSGKSQKIDKK